MAAPEDIVAAIKKHLQTAQAADGAHLDVRKRCKDAGLNLDEVTFKNADVTTWDDSEVVVGPNGEPTFLAKTMVDSRIKVNSVNGDKLIPREMALFSPGCMKMRNRCFVLPAKLIVVGKFADGTPITYGSRAHKMMILLDLFRQYLHQHGRTLAQATAEDKKLLKLWREKLMAQDVSSTQAAVYVKFLISNDMPEEEIVYYIEQHAYKALIRTCCMHIGGNQIVFTTDPERDKTLGPVGLSKRCHQLHCAAGHEHHAQRRGGSGVAALGGVSAQEAARREKDARCACNGAAGAAACGSRRPKQIFKVQDIAKRHLYDQRRTRAVQREASDERWRHDPQHSQQGRYARRAGGFRGGGRRRRRGP